MKSPVGRPDSSTVSSRRATFAWLGVVALFVAAVFFGACGGKVTFVAGGAGGAGGSPPENECFLGHCGEGCIGCVGDVCENGRCDDKGICQPPEVKITCAPPPPG